MRYLSLLILLSTFCIAQDITFPKIKHTLSEKRVAHYNFNYQAKAVATLRGRPVMNKALNSRITANKETLILETKDAITKAKIYYGIVQIPAANDTKPTSKPKPLPISLKNYFVVASKNTPIATAGKNSAMIDALTNNKQRKKELELVVKDNQNIGKNSSFSKIFAEKSFKIGQTIKIDPEAANNFSGIMLKANFKITAMTCKFKKEKVIKGKKCAVLETEMNIIFPTEITGNLKGNIIIRLDTSDVISMGLQGILLYEKQIQNPQGVVTLNIQGRVALSLETDFDGIPGILDRLKTEMHTLSVTKNIYKIMQSKDVEHLTAEAIGHILIAKSNDNQARIRTGIADCLGVAPYLPEYANIMIKYLGDDNGDVVLRAVFACANNEKLRQDTGVMDQLKILYDEEIAKSHIGLPIYRVLKKLFKNK